MTKVVTLLISGSFALGSSAWAQGAALAVPEPLALEGRIERPVAALEAAALRLQRGFLSKESAPAAAAVADDQTRVEAPTPKFEAAVPRPRMYFEDGVLHSVVTP